MFYDERLQYAAVVSFFFFLLSFSYKVWNERQMTSAYERQAVALEQIARQGAR